MRTLTSPLQVARHVLMHDKAWLLFVEVPSKTGGNFYRLVRNTRHVAADGKTWQAAAMSIELPEENAEGDLGEVAFTLPNVSRIPMALVEVDGEFLGQTLTCWLQHEANLATFVAGLSWTALVLSCEASEKVIRFRCGHPSAGLRMPTQRFDRARFPQLLPTGGA